MFFLSIMSFLIFALSGLHFAVIGDYVSSLSSFAGAAVTTTATVFMKKSGLGKALKLCDCDICEDIGCCGDDDDNSLDEFEDL